MVSTSAPGNEGGQAADSAPGIPGTSHDALSWYAVQTRYRFEKKVAEHYQSRRDLPAVARRNPPLERSLQRRFLATVPRLRICTHRRKAGLPNAGAADRRLDQLCQPSWSSCECATEADWTFGIASRTQSPLLSPSVSQNGPAGANPGWLPARVGGHPLTNWRTQPRSLHRIHSTLCSYQDRRLRD